MLPQVCELQPLLGDFGKDAITFKSWEIGCVNFWNAILRPTLCALRRSSLIVCISGDTAILSKPGKLLNKVCSWPALRQIGKQRRSACCTWEQHFKMNTFRRAFLFWSRVLLCIEL